jgi:hypothetical protein
MPRGFFTQSPTVLLPRAPSNDEVEAALCTHPDMDLEVSIERRQTKPGWLSGGTELLVPFGEAPMGHVHVDVLDSPWPDSMGDPKEDADLFGAWSMGAFGPLAFPGNLKRAAQQAVSFEGARDAVSAHRAFVRLRTSYLVGAGTDAPMLLPEGWSGLAELDALLQLVAPLLALPGACAYFDPNSEVIVGPERARSLLAEGEDGPPLELFSHVRLFHIDERWKLMDTVGLERLFLPDLELVFTTDTDPNEVADLLRNASMYLISNGAVIEDGHTLDGPEGTLRVHAREKSLGEPPRAVLRFVPEGAAVPAGVMD